MRNKEEILFKCHQIALDIGMEALRRAERLDGTAADKLKLVLRHYIEGVTDELQGTVVLLEEGMLTARHYREVVRRRDAFERGVRALVQAGIDDGMFAPRDPKIVAFAILGAANWVSKWYQPEGERTAEEIAAMLADYLVAGLVRASDGKVRRRRDADRRTESGTEWRGHGSAVD